jgi:hypothetical protein
MEEFEDEVRKRGEEEGGRVMLEIFLSFFLVDV